MKNFKLSKNGKSPLEREVIDIIREHSTRYSYSGSRKKRYEAFGSDLSQGGCSSGMIGELIYYSDTLSFYQRHQDEIDAMLMELLSDCGYKSPEELFRGWDEDDMFCRDTHNQNLIAWFGFEETAKRLLNNIGINTI